MSTELYRISRQRVGAAGVGGAFALPLVDVMTMASAFFLGGLVNFSYQKLTQERLFILVILTAAALSVFKYLGHYDRRRLTSQEVGDIIGVAAIGFLLDSAFLYLLKIHFSRLWVLTSWVLIALMVPLARRMAKFVMLRQGRWRRPTVVVGTGPVAVEAARAYMQDPYLGYDIVAFADPMGRVDRSREITVGDRTIPVVPLPFSSEATSTPLAPAHMVVAMDTEEIAAHEDLLERLCISTPSLDVISPLRGLPIANTRLAHFFSQEVLALRIHNNLGRPLARYCKRLFDLVVAGGIFLLVLPLMSIIALMLWMEGGPILFAQQRVGQNGRLFFCYKFRSMIPNAEKVLNEVLEKDPAARAEWEESRKLRNDPRITRLGHFLRRLSLDELPQLLNVIRGDMSLVGPRPVVPDELERYGKAKVYYLMVRPGLTGLWQVSGRSDCDYTQRVALDSWYVRNWSLWTDVVILFRTLVVVPARAGAY